MTEIIPTEAIERRIFILRGRKVMLDSDLAGLYDVETKYLVRQVKRNIGRFPPDFMLRLTRAEFLRCHFGTSKRGGRRYPPYMFTEQGIAMLSSVLNSERAIKVNILIMRAFVRLRELIAANKTYLSGHLSLRRNFVVPTSFRIRSCSRVRRVTHSRI